MDEPTVTPEAEPAQEPLRKASPPDMRAVRRQFRVIAKKIAKGIDLDADARELVALQIEMALVNAYTVGRIEATKSAYVAIDQQLAKAATKEEAGHGA